MTAIAFLVGAACSMASGIIGMYISVKSNIRTAAAARRSLVEAVQVAMRGGAVSGFLVVALSLLGVWGTSCSTGVIGELDRRRGAVPHRRLRLRRQLRRAVRPARRRHLHQGGRRRLGPRRQGRGGHPRGRPAQRGRHRRPGRRQRRRLRRPWCRPVRVHGGREHRRDDPGRGGLHDRPAAGWPNPEAWIFFPLVVRAFGLLATIVAMFFVRGREDEDPMNMLNRGYWVTTLLSVVGLVIATNVMMNTGCRGRERPAGVGLVLRLRRRRARHRVAFVYITQYYTAGSYRPVREIAEASKTGPATNIIAAPRSASRRRSSRPSRSASRSWPRHWLGAAGAPHRTPTATTSAASSARRSRRWACS